MPIYAYRCDSCGHAKDVLQKVSDPVLDTCPACGAATFRKQLTAAGFQLKGSGWYVTDFKGGAAPAAKPAEPATAAAPAGDAKPASGDGGSGGTGSTGGGGSVPPAGDGKAAAAGGCGASCACH